jgi:hypothetical protein
MKKIEYQTRRVKFCFNRVIELNQKMCVEVFHPKTINIKQYLSTDNFSVNNRNICYQIFTNNTTLYYTHRCDKGVIGGRGLTIRSGQTGN